MNLGFEDHDSELPKQQIVSAFIWLLRPSFPSSLLGFSVLYLGFRVFLGSYGSLSSGFRLFLLRLLSSSSQNIPPKKSDHSQKRRVKHQTKAAKICRKYTCTSWFNNSSCWAFDVLVLVRSTILLEFLEAIELRCCAGEG